jgi:GAF domain-containing protein/putative methionine-R-sulfoxide reductase with GAF domain
MSHFHSNEFNFGSQGENMPQSKHFSSITSPSTSSSNLYSSEQSSSKIHNIVPSPGLISKLTDQNSHLKKLWLAEQQNSKELREKMYEMEKRQSRISLLASTSDRILQKCFLAAQSISKQNEMFQTFAVELTTTLQVQHAALFFIDKDSNSLWSAGDYNYDINNSLLGQVYLKNKIVHIENDNVINKNNNDDSSNNHNSDSDYGHFEDSSSENILKRGIKTKNSLGYPIRHPFTNKTVAIIELINKISGAFTTDDIFVLKTISEKIALTLAHSQYYFALQKRLNRVQNLESEKRNVLIKQNQISVQKSVLTIQFLQHLISWDSYTPIVQTNIIETLKRVFKSPKVIFHIQVKDTNTEEDEADLKKMYVEIDSRLNYDENNGSVDRIQDFLLVSAIVSGDVKNNQTSRQVGILAVKRISEHASKFNSQDILLFAEIVSSLSLSRERWRRWYLQQIHEEAMSREIEGGKAEICVLDKKMSLARDHNNLYRIVVANTMKMNKNMMEEVGKKLHYEIFIQIQHFMEEVSDLQLYLIEHINVQKNGSDQKVFKSLLTNENDDNSINDLRSGSLFVNSFDYSENFGLVSYVANNCKLANVSKPSNDFRCNTSYDNANYRMLCVPLLLETHASSNIYVGKENTQIILPDDNDSKNEKMMYGLLKICRHRKFPEFSTQDEKNIISYCLNLSYALNYFQMSKNILSLQLGLRDRRAGSKNNDFNRAENLAAKLLMEQRFSKAVTHDLTSIHDETELFYIFTMVCDRLFRDVTSAVYIVDSENKNLWQPLGKGRKKRHVAGIGIVGYVIETVQTLNLSNAKESNIYDESIDGFINDDDHCPMLCKPLMYNLSSTDVAASGCILLRRTVSGRSFLPVEDKLLERLMQQLSLCWEHILLVNTEKLKLEILSGDLKDKAEKNVTCMNYSNELAECSAMDSLCSFLQYKINRFCLADRVTFFKYEKELLHGPSNLKIRLDKKSLVAHAFREKEIVRLHNNIEDHKHFSFEVDRYDDVSGPNALLYVPIEHLNKRIPYGVLCLYKQQSDSKFSLIDEQIARGFASQICSKISFLEGPLRSLSEFENKVVDLENTIKKKEEHMSKLRISDRALRSLGVISKTLNEENMYTCTKNEVQKLIGNCFADLILISTEPNFVSYKGNDGSFHHNIELTGILLDVYKEGCARLVTDSDIAKTLEYELPDGISRNNQIASMLLIPLVSSRGRILGIIRVGGKRGSQALNVNDKNTLLRIASVIASKIEIFNFSEEYNKLKLNASNGKVLKEDVDMLQSAIQGCKNVIKSNHFSELCDFTKSAMCNIFKSSKCVAKLFLVKNEETIWAIDPSSMKERQINRMSDSMSRVMVSRKPIFTSLQDGLIIAPVFIKNKMIALLHVRGTAKHSGEQDNSNLPGKQNQQQKRYSPTLMKIINHFASVLASTMEYINRSDEDKKKGEEMSTAIMNLRGKYVKETKAARLTQEILKDMLHLSLPTPFHRVSATLHAIICRITNAKTMRLYVCSVIKQNTMEYIAVDRSCKSGEGLVGKAIETGKRTDSNESSAMHFNSFPKCDMPASTPALSDIFSVRCFPIMSSLKETKEIFPSLKHPVCVGVLQIFTNADKNLSLDDEKFVDFLIPELEHIIVVRLVRELKQLQFQSIRDDRDDKVRDIKRIVDDNNLSIKQLKNQSEIAINTLKDECDLAIKELNHANKVASEKYFKEEQKLKIKIELQSFLWKVVETTKLRTTVANVHMIFQRTFRHIIPCSSAFVLLRRKEERKYTFYPIRDNEHEEPCYVAPPVNLLNILESHTENIRVFGETEGDEYNVVELEQAIGSQHVGSIKNVLAVKINKGDDINFMENYEGVALFIREVDEKQTLEKTLITVNDRDNEEEEDNAKFNKLDIEVAQQFSDALFAAFNFNYFMGKQTQTINNLGNELKECREDKEKLTIKVDKSYDLQNNLLSNITRLKASLLKSTEIFFKQVSVDDLIHCVRSFCEKYFHTSSIDIWWMNNVFSNKNRQIRSTDKQENKKGNIVDNNEERPMEQPTLYQRILSTEQYLCIDDVSDDSRFSTTNDFIQQRKTVTFLGMPLFRPFSKRNNQKQKAFGILALFKNKKAVHDSNGSGFSLDDLDILKHISNITSLALMRIMMHKRIVSLEQSLNDNIGAHKKLLNANNNHEVKTNSLLINIKDTRKTVKKLHECMSLCLRVAGSKDHGSIRKYLMSTDTFLPVDEAVLFSTDPTNDRFVEEIICTVDGRSREKIPFGTGCVGLSVKSGLLINIKNTADDQRYQSKYDRAASCTVKTALAVPVKDASGNPSGVLYLINKRIIEYSSDEDNDVSNHEFTELDETLACNLAACIGVALIHIDKIKQLSYSIKTAHLTNNRMKENLEKIADSNLHKIKKTRKNTSLLVGATCALMNNIDVPYKILSEQGCQILCCEKVYIFVYNQAKKELVSYNYVQDELHPHRIGLGQGIPGVVVSEGQPIVTNNPQKHKYFNTFLDIRSSCQTSNLICIPCVNMENGQTVGVIYGINHETEFKTIDIESLQPLASITASAIVMYRRKRKFDSTKKQERQKNTVPAEVQTDPDQMVQSLREKLSKSRIHHKKQLEKVYKTTEKLIQMEKNKCQLAIKKLEDQNDALIAQHKRVVANTSLVEEFT